MAAADDRRDLARASRTPPRLSWLGLVGFGLAVALLAVALVQARQFSLLRQAVQSGDDFAVLSIYEAEAEYLRLREQWRLATDDRLPLDADALRLRYEIWVSRIGLLRTERLGLLLSAREDHQPTMAQVQGFIAGADRALGAAPEAELSRTFVAALLPPLEALGLPIHGLSISASHRVAERLEQRTQAVRQQGQLGLALTVFLSVLTLAFAYIALRQVRQLRERRGVLEDLATNLRQARREAEAASEAKSAFLANMSHEIRTPFHGLMGMLSLLRETGLTAHQVDYLRTATESADHLLAILNDILDVSQLESGRMTLARAPVDLRALLRDVDALMRPQANAKALALHIGTDPDVPEHILADATRVKQIIFNLLANAIKFSDHGTVVLDVKPVAQAGGTAEIEFVITDTGIGMDEATLAHLFNRFVQGDNSRSRRHGGTGLGLEISRNLARLMGGDVAVRSKPGVGSCFTFRMPLHALAGPRTTQADSPPTDAAPSRPLQVLVAEDHPVNRQYMAALLESLGHQVHFTTNGQEAVQAARERRFDVVLMDLHMPVLDGLAATRAIRALPDPALSTVPIVALTADAFAATRERCLVAGMNDFLTKPVSPQMLATSLRRLFGSAAGTPPAATTDRAPVLAAVRSGTQPVIDEAAMAMALQAMPRARLAAMIESFLDQGPDTVQHLRAAVRDAQPLELRVNAHAATGAALNLGLAALAATAQTLQEGAAHLPAHEIARLVQRYEELLPVTRAAVRACALLAPPTVTQ
jgi:signal transduction histidine kinase/DNA-binding response OmpR family regulator